MAAHLFLGHSSTFSKAIFDHPLSIIFEHFHDAHEVHENILVLRFREYEYI